MLYPVELRARVAKLMRISFPPVPQIYFINTGRGGGIRTHDPLLPKQMRYQAALRPEEARILQTGPGEVNRRQTHRHCPRRRHFSGALAREARIIRLSAKPQLACRKNSALTSYRSLAQFADF